MLLHRLWTPAVSILIIAVGLETGVDANSEGIRELTYLPEDRIHYKQISEKGDSLVLGSRATTPLANKEAEYNCKQSDGTEYHKKVHETKIFKRRTESYEFDPKESLDEITQGSHIVYLTKEVWSCYVGQDTSNGFLRIVNEFIWFQEVREIKFYEGIEVNTFYDYHGVRTAKIKEIKYVTRSDDSPELLRYEGLLILMNGAYSEQNKNYGIVGFIQNLYHQKIETSENELFREVTFNNKEKTIETKVSDGPINLKLLIGSGAKTPLANRAASSICFREQGIYPFPFEFRTACSVKDEVEIGNNEHASRVLQITENDLADFFVPILEEVWNCKTTEGLHFIRIVTEMVGVKKIDEIEHYSGVTEIIAIKNYNGETTARVREIKYLHPITKEVLKYEGTLRLVEDESSPPKNQYGIHYKLNANRLYRKLISPEGYDLRVGSRWEKVLDKRTGKVVDNQQSHDNTDTGTMIHVICKADHQFDYAETYRTKFRVRVRSINDTFGITTYRSEYVKSFNEGDYYEYSQTEFLVCHSKYWKVQFIRVVNIIDILVPVHEIEFYDGVKVYENIISPNRKAVRIEETKFLDANNLDVIKYEGTLEVVGSTLTDGEKSGSLLTCGDRDIFWRVGHFTANKTTLRELKIDEKFPPIVVDMGESLVASARYIEPSSKTNRKIVVCQRNSGQSLTLFLSDYRTQEPFGADTFNRYFPKFRILEHWECKSPPENDEQSINFHRYVAKFYYKKKDGVEPIGQVVSAARGTDPKVHRVEVKVRALYHKTDGYNLEFTDIIYRIDPTGRFLFFDDVVLDESMDYVEQQKWSGTKLFEENDEKLSRVMAPVNDVEYKESLKFAYLVTLPGTKDLEIGTNWHRTFEDKHTSMTCTMMQDVERGQFDTYMRTRVNSGTHMHNQLLFDEYFDELRREVWECKKMGSVRNPRTFLRVLNQFSVKPHHCNSLGKLFHRDGITVMFGEYVKGMAGCMEIAEVKYLDPIDYKVLKFDGNVQIIKEGKPISKGISALRLLNVAGIEVHYLSETESNKLLRTVLKEKGLTIEVGSHYEETLEFYGQVDCLEKYVVDKEKYRTRILVNKVDGEAYKPAQMSIDDCFEKKIEVWDCQKGDVKFYRVMSELIKKEDCPLARIYHHIGVTVKDVGEKVTIREIKYVNIASNKVIRYEGFVNVIEVLHKPENDEIWGASSREIVYELDTPILTKTILNKDTGVILEAGSPIQQVFGTADDSVLCERVENHFYRADYTTKIASNIIGKKNYNLPVVMDETTFSKFFDLLRQEVWNCKQRKVVVFKRVVNFLVALKDIAIIYHPDGITFGTQMFPDETYSKQIKEVKYITESGTVLRYDGEVTLETIISKKATRLFQMPSQLSEFFMDTRPLGALKAAPNVKHWSLDVLRVHALRLIQNEGTQYYAGDHKVDYTLNDFTVTKIAEGYDVKMKVGTRATQRFQVPGGVMRCMLDEWNPKNKNQFLTKVLMYFGTTMYELDSDTITDHFNVKKIEVWICIHERETLLRVVTELEGTIGIFVVLHTDGVTVTKIPLGDGTDFTANIKEVKYLDPKTFQVIKYEGKVKLIKPAEPKKTEIAVPLWRQAVQVFQKYWFKVLRAWANLHAAFTRK